MGRDAWSCVWDTNSRRGHWPIWDNARFTLEVHGFSQSIVDDDDAIDEWRKRLQAWVEEKGSHFEHLL